MKYAELVAGHKAKDQYLLPQVYWQGQLQELEQRMKSWKQTIETNAFANIIKSRTAMNAGSGSSSARVRSDANGASSARGDGSKAKTSTTKAAQAAAKAGERHGNRWHAAELADLKELVVHRGSKDWDHIAKDLGTGRTPRAVSEKWIEFEKVQEQLGGGTSTGDELTDAAMRFVIAASGGSSRENDDLVVEGGAYEEHARENALILKEEGLAPVGPVWHEASTADGDVYYINATTGESSWEAPAAHHGDVITGEERLAWKDAGYNERFADQDRAEAEAEEVRQLEMSNLPIEPLAEHAMEEEEELRSPRGSGSGRRDDERAAAAAMAIGGGAVVAQEQISPEAGLLAGLRRKREFD